MNIDISNYPPFSSDHKNVELTLLSDQGFSNKNYTFQANNTRYLLRKFILQDRDRELEYEIQSLAYQKNIAAKPFILDLESDLMICEYLEGEHKSMLSKEDLLSIAEVLKKLHDIKIDKESMVLKNLFTTQTQKVREAFNVLEKYPKEMHLCHNDLNPKNLLFSNHGVKCIDWEYAGINDRYFDLAAVSVEFLLDEEIEAHFLDSYFETTPYFKAKLEAYKTIYIALCKEWFEALEVTQPSQI